MSGTANLHDVSEPTNHFRYATDFTLASHDSNLASDPSQPRLPSETTNSFAVKPGTQPQLAENGLQAAQHPHYHHRLRLGTKSAVSKAQAGQPIGQGLQRGRSGKEYHGRVTRSNRSYYHNRYPQVNEQNFQRNEDIQRNDTRSQNGYYHRRIPANAQSVPPAQYVNPSALSAPAPAYTNRVVPDSISAPPSQSLNVDMQRTYYNARMPDPIFMTASQSVNADMQHTYYNARAPQR